MKRRDNLMAPKKPDPVTWEEMKIVMLFTCWLVAAIAVQWLSD